MGPFLLIVGASLAALSIMGAWIFRSSSAPLAAKLAVPVAAIIVACCAPAVLNNAAGFPVSTTFDRLPGCFDIIAYSASDGEGIVSIWLLGQPLPRAYSLPIEKRITSGINLFIQNAQPGVSVRLCKDGGEDSRGEDQTANRGRPMDGGGGLHIDQSGAMPMKGAR